MTTALAIALVSGACAGDADLPVYPSFDQTIMELARGQSDLSNFVKLVETGGLVEAFDENTGVYTVFAPTNAALSTVPDDPATANWLARYHAIGGTQLSTLIAVQTEVRTLTSTTITVRTSGSDITLSNSQPSSGKLVRVDMQASNGVLHVIDAALTPPPRPVEPLGSLIDVATDAGDFASLIAAVDAVGLTDTLAMQGPFTLFAPTDAAFTALGDISGVQDEVIANILVTHVVDGAMSSATLLAASSLTNLGNTSLAIDGTAMTVGGSTLAAMIDLMADNGVVHGVDGVIIPPTITQLVVATADLSSLETAVTRTSTIIGNALEPDTLGGAAPITVFAPNNAGFTASGINAATVGTSTLAAVLSHHVVAGQMLSSDFTDGAVLTTANGTVTVNVAGDGTVTVTDGQNNTVNVVQADIRTLSGVVHVIDGVLIP